MPGVPPSGQAAGAERSGPSVFRLPRLQSGSQPQHLLLTLLADYFFGSSEPIPSGALVTLLAEFGITSVGSRAALSRVARRGLLLGVKLGRTTSYRLTPEVSAVLRADVRRLLNFGTEPVPWSGRWTVVAFSVPEDRHGVRPALRARLRELGFASLYDGVWVSPRPPTPLLHQALSELEVEQVSVLVTDPAAPPEGIEPRSAWDLGELARHYRTFSESFAELRRRVGRGGVGSAEALVERTRITERWRRVVELDPDLPAELLAEDWPRERARAMFVEIYDALGELAELRVRQIVIGFSPPLAEGISHHSTALVTR